MSTTGININKDWDNREFAEVFLVVNRAIILKYICNFFYSWIFLGDTNKYSANNWIFKPVRHERAL